MQISSTALNSYRTGPTVSLPASLHLSHQALALVLKENCRTIFGASPIHVMQVQLLPMAQREIVQNCCLMGKLAVQVVTKDTRAQAQDLAARVCSRTPSSALPSRASLRTCRMVAAWALAQKCLLQGNLVFPLATLPPDLRHLAPGVAILGSSPTPLFAALSLVTQAGTQEMALPRHALKPCNRAVRASLRVTTDI